MESMDGLHWPLSVLARAVHFKNLTSASAHVGLSQPQLSRLVQQLEKEFNITLLDRTARRKSGWTQTAHRLAQVYSSNNRKLKEAVFETIEADIPKELSFGTLEGLSTIALHLAKSVLAESRSVLVELDVFDQTDLEEKFINGDLDVILTSRNPGKQKLKHIHELGHQSFDNFDIGTEFDVMSPFEFGQKKRKVESGKKVFISNSLSLRRQWFNKFGGQGDLPGKVQRQKTSQSLPVLIVGGELLNEGIWQILVENSAAALKSEN